MNEELEAGRTLDELIAVRVFGLRVKWLPEPQHEHAHGRNVPIEPQSCDPPPGMTGAWAAMYWTIPRYSTDIAAAWEVVEKMRPARWLGLSEFRDGWRAIFSSTEGKAPLHPTGEADTMPLAICRAALKASHQRI